MKTIRNIGSSMMLTFCLLFPQSAHSRYVCFEAKDVPQCIAESKEKGEILAIRASALRPENIESLNQLDVIEVVEDVINEKTLPLIGQLKKLKVFHIEGFKETNEVFMTKPLLDNLKNLNNLEKLHIYGPQLENGQVLQSLLTLSNLKRLFFQIRKLSAEDLQPLLELPNLESVSFVTEKPVAKEIMQVFVDAHPNKSIEASWRLPLEGIFSHVRKGQRLD